MKHVGILFLFYLSVVTTSVSAYDSEVYVDSCYHRGRILWLEQNDPVGAMEVFLEATRVPCDNAVLTGRVYSNIATMCRRAERHDLAYDMYGCSAECFLQADSMVRYAYALNNMAFEQAVMGNQQQCDSLLSMAESACADEAVRVKLMETRAEAFLQAAQYDSAIHYAKVLYASGNHESTGLLVCAQAYTYLHENDSAVWYARQVMERTHSLYDRNNALFILTQLDNSATQQSTRAMAAERADVQTELTRRQGELALAVQLLEQHLNDDRSAGSRRWIWYVGLCLLLVVGIITYSILRARHAKHLKAEQRRMQLEEKCRTLVAAEDLVQVLHWKNYSEFCSFVDTEFYRLTGKLQCRMQLSEREVRMCVLVLLNVNTYIIADMLPYAENSIGTLKDRTAKKLGTTGKNLRHWLIDLAVGQKMDEDSK